MPFAKSVVSKVKEYGEVVLVPMGEPSAYRSTSVTPTSSVASALTETEPEMVEPSVGEVMDVVGGVVSVAARATVEGEIKSVTVTA